MIMNVCKTPRRILSACLVSSLLLAGCGGGDSTSADAISVDSLTYSPSAPVSGTPVSAVGIVSYSGTVSSSGVTYAWTQTSGPSVSLTGSSAATVYFSAPTVTVSTELVLKLTVTANAVSDSKSVTITVKP